MSATEEIKRLTDEGMELLFNGTPTLQELRRAATAFAEAENLQNQLDQQ